MRINRQRRVNRILKFYFNNFGFKKPFKVLIDGTFCSAALQNQINITEQLGKYLDGETKILTTPCAILEIEKLGPVVYGAMLILKKFPVHHCGHKTPIFAASCMKSVIGKKNENRYMLATQDRDLQQHIRKIPGVPLLYIFNKAPTLDNPNELSLHKADQHLHESCTLSKVEAEAIKKMKEVLLPSKPNIPQFKKKKKPKGPNPLSCKKKKTKGQTNKKVK